MRLVEGGAGGIGTPAGAALAVTRLVGPGLRTASPGKVAVARGSTRGAGSTLPAHLAGVRVVRRRPGPPVVRAEGADAPGVDSGGPDWELDPGRGRLAAGREQDGCHPARLRPAPQVLR